MIILKVLFRDAKKRSNVKALVFVWMWQLNDSIGLNWDRGAVLTFLCRLGCPAGSVGVSWPGQ